ncbi:MAG: hypothetical protein IKY95_03290 [Bacteroidales bacterium]|nr:hypothetical protein [Bacteroidales bacterium]
MKINRNFRTLYILLLVFQIILCNYSNLGPYVMLSMLPAMVLCIPLSVGTPLCLLIAFLSGLSVDWLSEGLIGLNTSALLPVAVLRRPFISSFIGEDLIVRKDNFSIRKNGFSKIFFALLASTAIFMCLYVFLDGAGTRPFWFSAARFGASLAANMVLGLIVVNVLTGEEKK